jgi:hypothetical protein
LESREKNAFKDAQWYRYGRNQNLGLWEQPKLLIPYMITKLSAYIDFNNHYYFINVTTGGYGITIDESKFSYSETLSIIQVRPNWLPKNGGRGAVRSAAPRRSPGRSFLAAVGADRQEHRHSAPEPKTAGSGLVIEL